MAQKSFLSELFETAAGAWVLCCVMGVILMTLSMMSIGRSLVPSWVLYTSAGLFAAGIFSGRAAKTYKGLVFGLLLLALTFATLGIGDSMSGADDVDGNRFAHGLLQFHSVLKIAFPLFGGIVAFAFPLMLMTERRMPR